MTDPASDLPLLIAQEITEDCVEEGMDLAALAKYSSFKVPKGVGRISLLLMARRINQEPQDGYIPVPKKTINRINYEFLKTAISAVDPSIRLAYFKEFHDRMDGKAAQSVALTDADGGKLPVSMIQLVPLKAE